MAGCLEVVSHSPGQTQEVGQALGQLARPGDVFLLVGELGSGKTTLTQGIAWGAGVQEHARSPTFVLVTRYRGRSPLYHIDLYRLDSLAEVLDLGLEEAWEEGVAVVEWAEKALPAFPQEHLVVRILVTGEEERLLRLEAHGPRYEALLADLAGELGKRGLQVRGAGRP